jgi:hypothetical protein
MITANKSGLVKLIGQPQLTTVGKNLSPLAMMLAGWLWGRQEGGKALDVYIFAHDLVLTTDVVDVAKIELIEADVIKEGGAS